MKLYVIVFGFRDLGGEMSFFFSFLSFYEFDGLGRQP